MTGKTTSAPGIRGIARSALILCLIGGVACSEATTPTRLDGGPPLRDSSASSSADIGPGALDLGPGQVVAPVPSVDWVVCDSASELDQERGAECARVSVPLDYDVPGGDTIELLVKRIPASDTERRIGSLFVNPGGPGGSSVSLVQAIYPLLGEEVTSRFDIVGIDPRGIGGSSAIRCEPASDESAVERPSVFYPRAPDELQRHIEYDQFLVESCLRGGDPVVNHMSTADVARDMDLLRQALGDDELNYVGISYGTYLGATYASMFPDRVRAIALDSVVAPDAWLGDHDSTIPFTSRFGAGPGGRKTLEAMMVQCDAAGPAACALAPNALERWDRVRASLEERPLAVYLTAFAGLPEIIREQHFSALTNQMLYGVSAYESIIMLTRLIEVIRFPFRMLSLPRQGELGDVDASDAMTQLYFLYRDLRRQMDHWLPVQLPGGDYRRLVPNNGFEAVGCSDSYNPTSLSAWTDHAAVEDDLAPGFGLFWLWFSSPCRDWPIAEDAFRGPFVVSRSRPLLLLNNLHDPATPIESARRARGLLDGSRLVEVDAFGHGAFYKGECSRRILAEYIVNEIVPAEEVTSCRAERGIFGQEP